MKFNQDNKLLLIFRLILKCYSILIQCIEKYNTPQIVKNFNI